MKKLIRKRNLLILPLLLIVGLSVWWLVWHRPAPPPAPQPIAINSTPAGSNTPTTANPNPNVGGGTPGNGVATGDLQAPSGTFVSNHHASLDPNDDRNREQSTCNTNVGATCDITFTKDGVTKSLGSQTASASRASQTGTASWSWTPATLGLTPGSWKITAVASLNGQTKSTTDTVNLEISQ